MVVMVVVVMMVVAMVVVAVIMPVTVIVADMGVSEGQEADEVHGEAEGADDQQFHDAAEFALLGDALAGFPDEFHADEHQEDAVAET
jgi:hypothetical protein